MKCIARNTRGGRCQNNIEIKKMLFCKDHNIKSDWFFMKNRIVKFLITWFFILVIAILAIIFNTEISELWISRGGIIKYFLKEEQSVENNFKDTTKFNILLLPFGSSQTCNNETILCERELKKYILTNSEFSNSKIEVIIDYSITNKEKIYTKEELEQICKKRKADLIIWGDYSQRCNFDSSFVQINYYINEYSEFTAYNKYGLTEYYPFSNITEISNGIIVGDIKNITNWILGYMEFNQGNFNKALEYFLKVNTKKDKRYAHLFHAIGLAYDNLLDTKKSNEYYTYAIELDSTYSQSYNNRGCGYLNFELFDLALKDFNKAIELTNCQYPDVYLNKGNLYREMGDTINAFLNYNQAFEINKNNDRFIYLFSLIAFNYGCLVCEQGNLNYGLEVINNVTKYDPNNENILIAKALCYLHNNDFDNSENSVNQFLKNNPQSKLGLAFKYNLLRLRGKHQEAHNLRKELLDILGEDSHHLMKYGFYVKLYGYDINII